MPKDKRRLFELIAHAVVCFERCSNPFAPKYLIENKVTADECRDLSHQLASILEEWLFEMEDIHVIRGLLERFRKRED